MYQISNATAVMLTWQGSLCPPTERLILLEFQTFFRHAEELLAVKFLELVDTVLVDGVDEEDFEALLLENPKEGEPLVAARDSPVR